MLNRIFFISETFIPFEGSLPAEDNIFFSILAQASAKEKLAQIYHFIDDSPARYFALTLYIDELPAVETIRSVTSFLFLPAYLRINDSPVINLVGNDGGLLEKTTSAIEAYLALQGFNNVIMNKLGATEEGPHPDNRLFRSEETLVTAYKNIYKSNPFSDRNVFFQAASAQALQSAYLSLKQAEDDVKQNAPALFSLATEKLLLEKELSSIRKKALLTETEMTNQKQYAELIRSDHSTRELQDYYNAEYEMLPRWYKRFGHLIKVMTGKRSFKSLYRNDVKRNKN